jgi:UDP-GlcNAc:undecaprenyl-phosphate GlcNAc-1-phosphate transferase
MDFLILFIAVVVPGLPGTGLGDYHLSLLAAKIIAMLFCYEVLIGEYRGQMGKIALSAIVVVAIICARAFAGGW